MTNAALRTVYLFSAGVLMLILSGCGSPPAIKSSQVMVPNAEKATSIAFIYRNVDMQSTYSHFGRGGVSVANMGFHEFGERMAKLAPAVFEKHGIAVVDSRELDGKTPIPAASIPTGAGGVVLPILIVNPVSGTLRANNHSTAASYVFSAILMVPGSQRIIWKATIDTSTWAGTDFVMKNIEKTTYDDNYAMQFLNILIAQMRQDGIV